MEHTLIANNISKKIKKREVLTNICLNLKGGNIYGFVGENGSGKTMLFRALSGLIKPTDGAVFLDGINIHKKHPPVKIGVIIENSAMWPDLSGMENLIYLSSLNRYICKEEVALAMVRVGLDPASQLPVRKYSLGMKQRLIVAQAVMEQPDFLFLDEPTNAVDKDGILLIRQIISEEAQRGAVVLLASHISQDISALCSEIYYMENGCCKKLGGMEHAKTDFS